MARNKRIRWRDSGFNADEAPPMDVETRMERLHMASSRLLKHPAPYLPCGICKEVFNDKEKRRLHWSHAHGRH